MRPDDKNDSINEMFVLELTYRLVVAVNMSEYKLEPISWRELWNSGIVSCVEKWRNHLSVIVDGDSEYIRCLQLATKIIEGLSRGYSRFISDPSAPSHDSIVYCDLLEQAAAMVSTFFKSTLPECFILGRQLAQNDLRAYYASKNKQELRVVFAPAFKSFTPFTEDSFPLPLPNWPHDRVFNNNLNRYIANRQHLTNPDSFSVGALLRLVQSIVCPSSFPSTVLCWEDWENKKPWYLFLAGSLFPEPTSVLVKDGNDKAFVILLEAMNKDKKAGCSIEDCGWIPRNELWPEKKLSNTRSKAWFKLTEKTLSALGKFESKGSVGKYKDTGGPCRAPAVLADPECCIFIEKSK